MNKRDKEAIIRNINGYQVETVGGFITIKHWIVSLDGEHIGTFFRFADAKKACLHNDFSKAYKKTLY